MSSKLVILAYATAVIKNEPKLDCWDQNLADRIVILLNQHEEGHQETVLTRSPRDRRVHPNSIPKRRVYADKTDQKR
uniref:Uncharacterized protein n=1 Tax=Caenorhabditis japonica TaxID=281687 RepID=A0A8R1ISD1_CAEJA